MRARNITKSLKFITSCWEAWKYFDTKNFVRIENSFSYPYSISSVTNELNVLLLATQHFEKRAKSFGVTSLTTNSTTAASTDIKAINEPGRLNTMVEEKKLAVDALNQESKRIADNAKAAYQLQ
ncbi:751_t:CDS:2 [Rhizophagus irregularis]|nr:751_t:CDS:2 [Rhizophagus irregularis]